ncbi:MAG: ParB/RepB/Spo0J family partition protein [Candidatus Aenigmatarchaeota archaeon]
MEIKNININEIIPNPWNPNIMEDDIYQHLKREYERVGYLQPILVRKKNDKYEIIDGEHRWRAAKEFGLNEITCIIIELDDEQAKLTTINMNKIKGTNDPYKLSLLIKDLNKTIDIETLSSLINTSIEELKINLEISEVEPLDDILIKHYNKTRYVICPNCNEKINLEKAEVIKE